MRDEKMRLLTAAVLGALAVWTAGRGSWAAPGFAALVFAQILILSVRVHARRGGGSGASLVGSVGLSYIGCAYLFAVFVATPLDWRFWLVFGVEVAILGPVILAFARWVLAARELDEGR